jgi:energy-coupling factor transport system permease protein
MRFFSRFHPLVLLIYFAGIIGVSMFTMNPFLSLTAIAGGLCFKLMLKGERIIRDIIFYLIFLVVAACINPVFSHNGQTVLFFVNDTAVTKESIIYGVCAALMMISVLCWFSCFSIVMTSDKIIYLFSGVSPTLGLVLSSALKFVPSMTGKYREIYAAQKSLAGSKRGLKAQMSLAVNSFSALITWAIEHTADSADSMSCRGYGIGKRSSFTLFRYTAADVFFMIFCLCTYIFMFGIMKFSQTDFLFYPKIVTPRSDIFYNAFTILWVAMSAVPLAFEITGELKWKLLKRKI